MPARKKPVSVKIYEGNRGKRPLPKPGSHPFAGIAQLVGEPDLPEAVANDPVALEHWRRLVRDMLTARTLTTLDGWVLEQRCLLASQLLKVTAQLEREGETVVSARGNLVAHPLLRVRGQLIAQLMQFSKELLLTPRSRDFDPAPPVEVEDSFDKKMGLKR